MTAGGWRGTRLRAAVDRLHAAQLAALATPAVPAAGRDAYGTHRRMLAQVEEMGSLLERLGRSGREDEQAAAVRRRLVTLAVAGANTLAELLGLAFEIERPAG